jgi:protein-disulfide isomerase
LKKLVFVAACLALVLAFVFAGSYFDKKKTEKAGFLAEENATVFVRDHSPTLGGDDAKVYLVEFLDPACEACASFSPFVKGFLAAHPGKIRLVVRYAPFHEGSDEVVKILEASRRQDKYWETLDVLFKSQGLWASHHDPRPDKIWQFLPMTGLDVAKLRKDMQDPAIETLIQQDLADVKTLGVRKTPSFFVNGKPLHDFGFEQLQELVESEIRANYPE